MSFKARSESRTATLVDAVTTYQSSATQERLFEVSTLTNISAQTSLRNNVRVVEDLAQLDREIERVQAMRDTLALTQNNLQLWNAKSKNMLAPISMLPNELLGYIFTCSIPISPRELADYTLALSTVCQLWRNVAVRYRALWAATDIRWHAAREGAWLRRAGGAPLSVFVDFPGTKGEDHMLSAIDYRGLLRQDGIFRQKDTWRSLEINIGTSALQLQAILGYIPTNCKGLESLSFIDTGFGERNLMDENMVDLDLPTLIKDMKGLVELNLRGVYPMGLKDVVQRFKTLRIDTVGARSGAGGSVRRWWDLLNLASSLESLEATWDRMQSAGPHRPPEDMSSVIYPRLELEPKFYDPVSATALKSLKLVCVDQRVVDHLLSVVKFPALEELSMEFDKAGFNARVLSSSLFSGFSTFFEGMPSVTHVSFKGHLEVLRTILIAQTLGDNTPSTSPLPPNPSSSAITPTYTPAIPIRLPNLTHLTLRAFSNSYHPLPSPPHTFPTTMRRKHESYDEPAQRVSTWVDRMLRERGKERLGVFLALKEALEAKDGEEKPSPPSQAKTNGRAKANGKGKGKTKAKATNGKPVNAEKAPSTGWDEPIPDERWRSLQWLELHGIAVPRSLRRQWRSCFVRELRVTDNPLRTRHFARAHPDLKEDDSISYSSSSSSSSSGASSTSTSSDPDSDSGPDSALLLDGSDSRDSEQWHYSQVSYTDEADIDQMSEDTASGSDSSSDDDAWDDHGHDGGNPFWYHGEYEDPSGYDLAYAPELEGSGWSDYESDDDGDDEDDDLNIGHYH